MSRGHFTTRPRANRQLPNAEKLVISMRVSGEGIRKKHSNHPEHLPPTVLPFWRPCWLFDPRRYERLHMTIRHIGIAERILSHGLLS